MAAGRPFLSPLNPRRWQAEAIDLVGRPFNLARRTRWRTLRLGFGLGARSEPGKRFYVYAQESIAETKKVVWPTRKETLQTTGVVFAFVVVMALFLWLVDASLLWVVQKLMGQGD